MTYIKLPYNYLTNMHIYTHLHTHTHYFVWSESDYIVVWYQR